MVAVLRIMTLEPGKSDIIFDLSSQKEYTIGRAYNQVIPDISFNHNSISKQHAKLTMIDHNYFIRNINNVNGVGINCDPLKYDEEMVITDGDIVCLAPNIKFQLLLNYSYGSTLAGATVCNSDGCRFNSGNPVDIKKYTKENIVQKNFFMHEHAQEILVDGDWIYLNGRQWELMKLLCEKHDEIVTVDEIIKVVWNNSYKVTETNVRNLVKIVRERINDKTPFKYILTRDYGYLFSTKNYI